MLSDAELTMLLDRLQSRLDAVNTLYIRKIASQIAKIGKLGQANVNRLIVMAEMTQDIDEITQALAEATGQNEADVYIVYQKAMNEVYTDPRFTAAFKAGNTLPPVTKERLRTMVSNISQQTFQTMENLSNTTAISKPYQDAVDRAIIATASGLASYGEATRDILRRVGYGGLQVQYASGYHRRLDTAVRQNVIDGTKQISQNGAKAVGEALGYDAYELSAHAHSAPDHEPVQGHVLLKEEYDKMQAGLAFVDVDGNSFGGFNRPIGEWNCQHFAFPFSTKFSKRQFTQDQLDKFIIDNHDGCDMDGKHYTTYGAQQLMRKTETEVRRWKDTANAARIAGDENLRIQCQVHINELMAKYYQIANLSGLKPHQNRTSVDGFRAVKVPKKTMPNNTSNFAFFRPRLIRDGQFIIYGVKGRFCAGFPGKKRPFT